MNRLIVYSIAASVGLGIAALLSIPTFNAMRDFTPAQQQTPAPVATQTAPPAAAPAAPVENQTLLAADLSMGQLTVTVNGTPAGSLQGASQLDITRFCQPGQNTVRLMWVGPAQGGVKASHTASGLTRDLTETHLVAADTQAPGVQSMSIYL